MRVFGIKCVSTKDYPDVDSTHTLVEDVGLFRSANGVLQAKEKLDEELSQELLDKRAEAAVEWEDRPHWERALDFEEYFDRYYGYQFSVEYVVVGLDLNH